MQSLDDLNFESEAAGEESKAAEYAYSDRIFIGSQGTYHRTNFYKEYSSLCTDLKQLYVCITRPKKRLIIYDEDPSTREAALKYWQKLDAVDVVTEEFIQMSQETSEHLTED
jgi:hypothetical protein